MTIFHGLPFVFRVIMMNPGFVSSGDILCQISIADRCFIRKSVEAVVINEHYRLTHCGRVTQICVFNTVKLGTSAGSP